jgi:hypothetical protein
MSMQVNIRASSWSDLFDCAMRWEAKNLLKKWMPSGPRAALGTALHAGTEAFDLAKMNNSPITADHAAEFFIDSLYDNRHEVTWGGDNLTISDAERIGLRLLSLYATTVNLNFIAVELTCAPLSINVGDGLIIVLTGTTDRIYIDSKNKKAIADVKSGINRCTADGEVSTAADGAQLGVYELLASSELNETIDGEAAIIGLQTTKAGSVAVSTVPNTRSMLIGTPEEPGMLHMAAMYLKAGLFPPNPKSSLCSEKYCPIFTSCKYHN